MFDSFLSLTYFLREIHNSPLYFLTHNLLFIKHVGCSGVGFSSLPEAPSTLPTVGTNLVTVRLSRKIETTLREVGGTMAPIWNNYLKGETLLCRFMDLARRSKIQDAPNMYYIVFNNKLD